ncbi:unnamed protein product [Schistosoma turkestanicum]|nr:unnamed protein product [Schistosoma turkestanicum]
MCNLLSNYQDTLDSSETDSWSTNAEYEDLKIPNTAGQKSDQSKENNTSKKSMKNINYKSKLTQHKPQIKSTSQPKSGCISSTCLPGKPSLSNKLYSDKRESNEIALANANSLIVQLNKELTDCKLELRTILRQYKMQAVRLDKAIAREAEMPEVVDRLKSEIRTLQIRLHQKTLESSADKKKISELQRCIYMLDKKADERHNQSKYSDEGSMISQKRSEQLHNLSVELQEEKKKNSQLECELDLMKNNYKQQISVSNKRLRSLRQECRQLRSELEEKTVKMQTELFELQNAINQCIPKHLVISEQCYLQRPPSLCFTNTTNNTTNEIAAASQKFNGHNNNLKLTNNVDLCRRVSSTSLNNDGDGGGVGGNKTRKLSSGEPIQDGESECSSSKAGFIQNTQIDGSSLGSNKENVGKSKEEELWNDIFGSKKDNNSESRRMKNEHRSTPPSDGHLFTNDHNNNNNNLVNGKTLNSSNQKKINFLTQKNNITTTTTTTTTNDITNNALLSNANLPSWLTFNQTISKQQQHSNDCNNTLMNNRHSLIGGGCINKLDNSEYYSRGTKPNHLHPNNPKNNRFYHHITTTNQLDDNVDSDMEELQI